MAILFRGQFLERSFINLVTFIFCLNFPAIFWALDSHWIRFFDSDTLGGRLFVGAIASSLFWLLLILNQIRLRVLFQNQMYRAVTNFIEGDLLLPFDRIDII